MLLVLPLTYSELCPLIYWPPSLHPFLLEEIYHFIFLLTGWLQHSQAAAAEGTAGWLQFVLWIQRVGGSTAGRLWLW